MLYNVAQMFYGPNWHADYPACERLVILSAEEKRELRENGLAYRDALLDDLREAGLEVGELRLLRQEVPDGARRRFAFLLNNTALTLQRHAGHRVSRSREMLSTEHDWLYAIYEAEHAQAGASAGRVALFLMARVIPSLEFTLPDIDPGASVGEIVSHYRERAATTLLPLDTRRLIAAARRAGIPFVRWDQAPFTPGRGRKRIRVNGGLVLGQGRHCKEIDGTFCLTSGRRLAKFAKDRVSMMRVVASTGATVPRDGDEPDFGLTVLQAVQATERLGYPVVIKPTRRRRGEGVTLDIRDVGQLMSAVNRAQAVSKEFIVERMVKGDTWRLIVAGGETLGALRNGEEVEDLACLHDSVKGLAEALAEKLKAGLVVVTMVTPDVSQPLEEAGGAVVDLDPAPELERLLAPASGLWGPVMDTFVEWLFPPGTEARIPIVAVTGSNGKTTTCRMIEHLARHAGFKTGLACSEGLYRDGRQIHDNQAKRRMSKMRYRLMCDRRVGFAVVEYYLSRIKSEGFPFDFCNVGVLTNVIPEHLQTGLENPHRIAAAKRSVLERARDGVVLNADSVHTAGMMRHLKDRRVALTSVRRDLKAMRDLQSGEVCCVLLEERGGQDRIVIHDGHRRIDLMAVADIPATFGGSAVFNVENALQAIAAGHLLGLEHEDIVTAMAGFEMNFENTPGRLNIYDGWPFRVIMDYAHNGEGISKLCDFTDTLEVPGRRILLYSVSGDRTPKELEETTLAAVGHFDHYVLRSYPDTRGREPEEVPVLMQECLIGAGVAPEQLTVIPGHTAAIDATLGMGRPGDLLVMTVGIHEMSDMWARIQEGPPAGA